MAAAANQQTLPNMNIGSTVCSGDDLISLKARSIRCCRYKESSCRLNQAAVDFHMDDVLVLRGLQFGYTDVASCDQRGLDIELE